MADAPRRFGPTNRLTRLRRLLAAAGTACLLGTATTATMALGATAAHAVGTAFYVDCSA